MPCTAERANAQGFLPNGSQHLLLKLQHLCVTVHAGNARSLKRNDNTLLDPPLRAASQTQLPAPAA